MAVASTESSLVGFTWSALRYKDYVEVILVRPGGTSRITLTLLLAEAAELGALISQKAAEE